MGILMLPSFKNSSRRFGVELEYNAFDGESRSRADNDLPKGIYSVASYLQQVLLKTIDVTKWQYTHDNKRWAIKPDSSCGIEVCSPPMRGKNGIAEIKKVVTTLSSHPNVKADSRCSLHVHVEIADFTENQIVSLLRNWVRFEPVFFILCNPGRWLNQYCIPVGLFSEFDSRQNFFYSNIMHRFSEYKYYSVNLFHYGKGRKKTIEFRTMGSEGCLNPEDAENWLKILLCFVDFCGHQAGFPSANLSYGDPSELFEFLHLNKYFVKDNEILYWIIEKLSCVVDKSDNDYYIGSRYFWESYLKINQAEFKTIIERLEKMLS
jgi:hypothetical protein